MKRFVFPVLFALLALPALAQTGLKVGDAAPDFTGKDQSGQTVSLASALKNGPVVLVFYRGFWCPYCSKQVSALQDSLRTLTAKGATVIAVSPEVAEGIGKTVEKTKASFAVVSDTDGAIMKAYDVRFELDAATATKYKGYGLDFAALNGANGSSLPVPATYVIGKDGKVAFVHFDPDFKNRPSVATLANAIPN
ncbi:MAG: peroxiredoxin-like family protein [Bacteroidia bacterium]|nr:peroxiredoxin-like family protein [Bacteroidia bacterium]